MFGLHIYKNENMNPKQVNESGVIEIHGFPVKYYLQKIHSKRGYNIVYLVNGKTFSNLLQVNYYIESIYEDTVL
jgi:hypothetical protein